MVVVLSLPVHVAIKWSGSVLLLVYGVYVFYRHVLLGGRDAITKLRCDEDSWFIFINNQWVDVDLRGDTLVTGRVLVLRFRAVHRIRPYSCVIFKDGLPKGCYRELLVGCRLG